MVHGIGSADSYWGDVKIITSGKRSAIRSDISDKRIIVYTSFCIESSRIEKNSYENNNNHNYSSHTLNEDVDAFEQ